LLLALFGSAAFAAEPTPFSAPRYVSPELPVEVCGLSAPALDRLADVLVETGGVREAAGDEQFLAFESLDRTRIWTFTRKAHAAHPSVACRTLADGPEGLDVSMEFACAGRRPACEGLFREFLDLNAQMRAKARKPS
jgi:hypothetical protein